LVAPYDQLSQPSVACPLLRKEMNKINNVLMLLVATSLVPSLGLAFQGGSKTVTTVPDVSTFLKGNISQLKDCKVVRTVNGNGPNRFRCVLFDKNDSQFTITASWRAAGDSFNPTSRQLWNPIPLSSSFSLGRTMSNFNNESLNIIGDRCEVSILCLVRSNGERVSSKENARSLEEIAPRAFALIQYQALKELNIPNTYQLLDSAKLGANFKFDADNCQFTLTSKKAVTRGCVGSLDIFVNGKKLKLKNPVLLDEAGIVRVDQDFLKLIQ